MSFVAVPGTEIGDYVVVSELGRGGMAIVYLAEHAALGRKIALKVLAPELADDETFRARFLREARLAAGLEHPNIVPVYDAGEAEGLLYIAMRYVDGTDLAGLLKLEGRLTMVRALNDLAQIAMALDAAHSRGLVHRDVKPSNVLIMPGEGAKGTDHAYLADFGLARPQLGATSHTAVGELYGTVDYMAPEQIEGKPLDARSDVYALACLAYECLVGEPPFRRETAIATASAHLHQEPVPPSELIADLPSNVEEAILRGLAKDKASRFTSAGALVAAIAGDGEVLLSAEMHAPPSSPAIDALDRGIPRNEERKVVTVLVCTIEPTRSIDPEEWRTLLGEATTGTARAVESLGGTVLGRLGGTITAVFGAPTLHEDDAERAVRASLSILAELEDSGDDPAVTARIGVDTGEAVVVMGSSSSEDSGPVTGDVMSTSSRIQGVTIAGSVVVGEATYLLTKHAITYETLSTVVPVGGFEPLRVWGAIEPLARLGAETDRTDTWSFIGRLDELEVLRRTFARVLRHSEPQVVVVTGEPGIGKSRLLREFGRWADDREELIIWRQGQCLAYGGEGTFRPLAEIVKAHAGIYDTDPADVVETKLQAAVRFAIELDEDRAWVAARLGVLIGIPGSPEGVDPPREELFAAWRRFLLGIADQGPLILTLEDLHWADDALLDFVEELAEEGSGAPILIVGTARPELRELHPDFGRDLRAISWIPLSSLTDDEIGELVQGILGIVGLPHDVRELLLGGAGGNPLFAEQFTSLLREKGVLIHDGKGYVVAEGADVSIPASVAALIGARLDTLSSDRKQLLHDAAVVGKVFWLSALVQLSDGDPTDIRTALRELSRKELVRRARRSSVEGDEEYSFWHAVTRDTAYAQIPRSTRAEKHLGVAAWIDRLAGERRPDQADLLAYHYREAYSLERAAGKDIETLGTQLRHALADAGQRLAVFDTRAALNRYQEALELEPSTPEERGALFAAAGGCARELGDPAGAERFYSDAIEALVGPEGDVQRARIMLRYVTVLRDIGERAQADRDLGEAVAIIEASGTAVERADAVLDAAMWNVIDGRPDLALDRLDGSAPSLEAAREDPEIYAELLATRGSARCDCGDAAGIQDLIQAVDVGRTARVIRRGVGSLLGDLGYAQLLCEGPAAAVSTLEESIDIDARRGFTLDEAYNRSNLCEALFDSGRWDEALAACSVQSATAESLGSHDLAVWASSVAVSVAWARGSDVDALPEPEALASRSSALDPQAAIPGLVACATLDRMRADPAAARGRLMAIADITNGRAVGIRTLRLTECLRLSAWIGDRDLADRFVEGLASPNASRMSASILVANALRAEMSGSFAEALAGFEESVPLWERGACLVEATEARAGAGRSLLAIGRPEVAQPLLANAREVFARLGASRRVYEIDA